MTIEIGSTVTDEAKKMIGIVLEKSKYHDDRVMIRCWSPYVGKYVDFPKKIKSLIEIQDPFILSLITTEDYSSRLSYGCISMDLALMTGDRKWFEEIVRETPELFDTDKNAK